MSLSQASLLVAVFVLVVAAPSSGEAQIPVARWEGGGIDLTGYVRALGAVRDAGFDPPDGDRTTAFAGQVARLKWSVRGGNGWLLEVHDRVQTRVTPETAAEEGAVVGFGVSAVPDRSVDLENVLVAGDRVRLTHDIDRLALTLYARFADITVGRQAITWGLSTLFPVADLWSRFSPYELDTDEKPGVDAIRFLSYPGEGVEIDAVVADRGSLDDLSAGARATWTLGWGDLYVGGGKLWREAIVMAGVSRLLDDVKLRAEAAFPREISDVDGDGDADLERPRVTLGADWITGAWVVTGEVHFNGIGEGDPSRYLDLATGDPRIARGESYYLGRVYTGALVAWQATDRLSVSATTLFNAEDPSASLTPAVVYDIGQNARFSAGGLLSAGDRPAAQESSIDPVRFRSEFGAYGTLGWTQFSIYF